MSASKPETGLLRDIVAWTQNDAERLIEAGDACAEMAKSQGATAVAKRWQIEREALAVPDPTAGPRCPHCSGTKDNPMPLSGAGARCFDRWHGEPQPDLPRQADQASDYCPKCHKMIMQLDVNYGINPDAVCMCKRQAGSVETGAHDGD